MDRQLVQSAERQQSCIRELDQGTVILDDSWKPTSETMFSVTV